MAPWEEGGFALGFSSIRASAAAAAICASSVGPCRGFGAASAFGFSLGTLGQDRRSSRGSSRGTASRGPAATRSFLAPEAPFGGTQRVFPNHCMPHSGHPGRAASPRP